MKEKFRVFVVGVFTVLAAALFAAAAFADPHVSVKITSLYAAGNQLSVTMNIINDGDTDCTVTKIDMQNLEIWDNEGNMSAFFTIENMRVYVEADHYVTKTYDINLPNHVPHEFINPGFKFRYSVEWRQEQDSDDDSPEEDDSDGDDDDDTF